MFRNAKTIIFFGLFLFSFMSFAYSAQAYYGPKAYLTEYVTQNYWWNGTPKGLDLRKGYVQVSVPNNADVLQYVRVNINPTSNTDLINSTAYDNVVTSYTGGTDSPDMIYVNTSSSMQSSAYNITNSALAPTINLTLSYTNYFGGSDFWDGENIWPSGSSNPTNTLRFNFTIVNGGTKALNTVTVVLRFNTSAGPSGRDAVNITLGTNTTTGVTTTSSYISDSDTDGDYDRYTWVGNLGSGAMVYILFNATLTEGATGNIFNNDNYINLDGALDKGTLANYSEGATLTGRTFNDKFARSNIRQGADLQLADSTWFYRAFIRNTASASPASGQPLTYNITEWRIYEVNPGTGAPYSLPNFTGKFNTSATSSYITPSDGTIYTTDSRSSNTSWYPASSTKPYVASYFDWYVCWNDSASDFYYGQINTTMDLQTLYKIDQANTKAITGVIYPNTGGQTVTINDTVYYTGMTATSGVAVGKIDMWSIIPANNSANVYHGRFEIQAGSIQLYFYNSSGGCQSGCRLQGNANVNWSYSNPGIYGINGTVRVSIGDLSSALNYSNGNRIGVNLSQSGDRIVLVYSLTTNVSMTTGDTYNFIGNTTFNSTSGTPEAELHTSYPIQVSSKRLIGYKELFIPDPASPTKVNATIQVTVESSGGEYIGGIKFLDYVLDGTFGNSISNYVGNITVRFFNGTWNTWANNTGYKVSNNGSRTLTDGTVVNVYEFINATGSGLYNLTNGEIIQVDYQMDIGTSGTYILPLQIAAFDPATGETFSAESWGVVRVDVPTPAVPLQITDHELELAKRVVVGTPAVWIKSFEVYNPNPRPISSSFSTTVFADAMDGFVSYYNENGEKIEEQVSLGNVQDGRKPMSWGSTLNPFETRTYEVRVLTPPVVEIDRDIQVLDKLEGKMVKLKMDIFLKSFAEEPYSNIVLNLPISYENILEVKDGFGRPMQFSGGKDTSSIIADGIEPAGLKTISVVYKASYPTIIITPDRDRYNLESPVSLEILVINGGETIDYPYMEVEIYTPGMDVIYSNIERLKTIEPLEKTQMYEKFLIPASAPGGMYIASAKFREDFQVLASSTGNFFVVGSASTPQALQIVAVLSITAVLVYFSLKRLREVRRTRALMQGLSVPEQTVK
jgi:hypothetical protein